MVTVSDLQAQVASRFELLDLPSWINPHANMESPREEEYSRITNPERLRVVHSRARLWAAVLQDVLGAHTETLTSGSFAPDDHSKSYDRGVRLTSRQPGALPLLLLERDIPISGAATSAVLDIRVGDLGVLVASWPDCICDACDSGSSDLLDAVDSTIGHVIGGPFVVLQGETWRAHWHPGGGGASSEGRGPDFTKVMDLCRRLADGETVRLPRHTDALVGRSWLS